MSTVRVAVVQAATVFYDTPATLNVLRKYTKEAASTGAQLVLFPEAFIGGYPRELGFGAVHWRKQAEGRDEFAKYFNAAISDDGDEAKQIGAAAKENNIWIVVGVIERGGATLYCSVFFFNPDGNLEAKHRKVIPTCFERVLWGRGDGSTMPVLDTAIGKIGTAICWENYMPLYRVNLYSKGVQIYLAPTADSSDEWLPSMQMIALEGRCFVVSACQYFTVNDYPEGHPIRQKENVDKVLLRGGSCVIDPLGKVLLKPDFTGPGMKTVDLDLSAIPKAKFDLDTVGHYNRPDIFQLIVDERKKNTVTNITDNNNEKQ